MECNYKAVNTDESKHIKSDNDWKPLLRQIHIISGVWTLGFITGLCTGLPTVFIPQIRRESISPNAIDDDLASWFYSTPAISSLPWLIVLPTFTERVGRKPSYILAQTGLSVCCTILYFSSTPRHILVAQVFQGFVNACNVSMTFLIYTEYSAKELRGVFINIGIATFFWGMLVANTIGTFFHWKYIPMLGIICSAYAFTTIFFPESPHWFASKGKFEQCRAAHRWLFGVNEASEKELNDLVKSQMDHEANRTTQIWSKCVNTVTCRQFYMPLMLSIVSGAQYNFSGKFTCSSYAIDIIHKITNSESAAYTGMLILDGITVFGMYFGCFLSKILERRSLYMNSSFLSVAFLLIMSLYLYLIRQSVIAENKIVSLLLLMAYSLSITCGPILISLSIYCEIIPIRFQRIGLTITSVIFSGLNSLLLKLAPWSFLVLGMDGSFLFFGVTSGLCTIFLYFYLPETKNKSIVEIEEYFKHEGTIVARQEESNNEL